ncbi:hypothetical protein BG003_005543 [Podila horticola]|nr:hypothetical protein BG003_005543 [Podila horticola]
MRCIKDHDHNNKNNNDSTAKTLPPLHSMLTDMTPFGLGCLSAYNANETWPISTDVWMSRTSSCILSPFAPLLSICTSVKIKKGLSSDNTTLRGHALETERENRSCTVKKRSKTTIFGITVPPTTRAMHHKEPNPNSLRRSSTMTTK